jgi:hypothetical protein
MPETETVYFVDGDDLYELVAQTIHVNSARAPRGQGPTFLVEAAVENCRTGDRRLVTGETYAALQELVREAPSGNPRPQQSL